MSNHALLALPLLGALALAPAVAHSEGFEVPQRRAFVVNAGPMIGVLGGGAFGRINPEIQLHRAPRYEGHAFNIGLAIVIWPNEGGPSFSVAPRYQFDHQLVPGTKFFVSPYAGLDLGLGVFDVFSDSSEVRFALIAAPLAGLDVKLLLSNRMVLGFRPIGVTVPVFIGGPRVTADVIYDIALSLGMTY
jgi:hypothetical protein